MELTCVFGATDGNKQLKIPVLKNMTCRRNSSTISEPSWWRPRRQLRTLVVRRPVRRSKSRKNRNSRKNLRRWSLRKRTTRLRFSHVEDKSAVEGNDPFVKAKARPPTAPSEISERSIPTVVQVEEQSEEPPSKRARYEKGSQWGCGCHRTQPPRDRLQQGPWGKRARIWASFTACAPPSFGRAARSLYEGDGRHSDHREECPLSRTAAENEPTAGNVCLPTLPGGKNKS